MSLFGQLFLNKFISDTFNRLYTVNTKFFTDLMNMDINCTVTHLNVFSPNIGKYFVTCNSYI